MLNRGGKPLTQLLAEGLVVVGLVDQLIASRIMKPYGLHFSVVMIGSGYETVVYRGGYP